MHQSCNVTIILILHLRCGTGLLTQVLNPSFSILTHAEFRDAFQHRKIRVDVDPDGAARFLSARLLLPFVVLPVLGIGVALALMGWIWTGLTVIAVGIAAPRLIKRSAPHFILTQALGDERIYREVTKANILRISPAN